ncbi:MAG: trigger factor [Oscillospiraceae bacterium]|nr:trigger factor [Oscillospiraceae bacterium]
MEIISNNKTGANTVEAEIKVNAADFEAALQATYLKQRKNIALPGFRKGKATRKMIEAQYGENVFFEEAVNSIYQKTVADAIDELKLEVVDVPATEVTSVSKEEGVSFKVTFTVKPEVTIDGYKGLKVEKAVKTITDADVDAEVERVRNQNARIIDVTDRAVEKGDTVVFDFEGFCDGVAFDGGKAEKFSLEIGSGRFIPGFEDQIVGKNIDEEFDVNVTFPEDYNAENLAGKPAVFKCKLHEIKGKELADLDDEFAKDVSEFDTIAEYKADIKAKLEETVKKQADSALDNTISEKLAELLVAEVPEAMFENRIADMLREWEYRNRYAGITLADYLKYTGLTIDQFKENFRAPAEIQVKLRLALEKIAELEKIEIDDAALEEQYKNLADEHKMDVEKVKGIIPAESLKADLAAEKAFELVKTNADITEVEAKAE